MGRPRIVNDQVVKSLRRDGVPARVIATALGVTPSAVYASMLRLESGPSDLDKLATAIERLDGDQSGDEDVRWELMKFVVDAGRSLVGG